MATLQIVLSDHCFGCEQALFLSEIVAEEFPELRVVVVNIDDSSFTPLPPLLAIPAYILDGETIFLGNPPLDQLEKHLSQKSSYNEPEL